MRAGIKCSANFRSIILFLNYFPTTMTHPAFFDAAPEITMHDPLAEFLGAASDGQLTYHYVDAVKLAGHSCPTVAGAYLMTRRALQVLYPDTLPQRGAVTVEFAKPVDDGVTGVIASVIGLITGAAGIGGFKGIGSNFNRRNLLQFGSDIHGEVCFRRQDNGADVQLNAHLHRVPAHPQMGVLLQRIMAGGATPAEAKEFAALWQDRVQRILIDHADDPELITTLNRQP
jgi:formylmethanofuran dehydrogenase subunit E